MASVGVFAYGSLVLPESVAMTLGRPVPAVHRAELVGWRRRFSQVRDNHAVEKTFELADGTLPRWILGLNIERGEHDAGAVNGAVIELEEPEVQRLAARELRYEPVELTGAVAGERLPEQIVGFTARAEHRAPEPPAGAVIIAAYASAVEAAFEALGPGELARYMETTGPYPVEPVDAVLIRDAIPDGNPREW